MRVVTDNNDNNNRNQEHVTHHENHRLLANPLGILILLFIVFLLSGSIQFLFEKKDIIVDTNIKTVSETVPVRIDGNLFGIIPLPTQNVNITTDQEQTISVLKNANYTIDTDIPNMKISTNGHETFLMSNPVQVQPETTQLSLPCEKINLMNLNETKEILSKTPIDEQSLYLSKLTTLKEQATYEAYQPSAITEDGWELNNLTMDTNTPGQVTITGTLTNTGDTNFYYYELSMSVINDKEETIANGTFTETSLPIDETTDISITIYCDTTNIIGYKTNYLENMTF